MTEEDIREQIAQLAHEKHNYAKRLQKLKERKAILGLSADVSLEIEINDIETVINTLDQRISEKKQLLLGDKYKILKALEDAIKELEKKDTTAITVAKSLASTLTLIVGGVSIHPVLMPPAFFGKNKKTMIEKYKTEVEKVKHEIIEIEAL